MAARAEIRSKTNGRSEYQLTWIALAVGAACALGVLHATEMVVGMVSALPYAALLSFLFLGHYVYARRRPDERISLVTGSVGMMIAAALFAGITANAGLRLRYPLVDDALARADIMLGMATPAFVLAVAERPWLGDILGIAYVSIFPLSFATVIWLGIRRQSALLWQFTLAFSAGIVGAAAISVFFPALGNIVHAGLDPLAGSRLPAGAGVYHLQAVYEYRDGTDVLLELRKLEGVVTFPSFHMIMAVAVGYAFRTTRLVVWPIGLWCALVAISTVPIGGHYVIDLLGGVALWLVCLTVPRYVRMKNTVLSLVVMPSGMPEQISGGPGGLPMRGRT